MACSLAYSKVVAFLLVALISSLVSRVQIYAAVINLHSKYIRARQDVLRLLSMNSGHHKVKKKQTITESDTGSDQEEKRMVGQFYQWHNDQCIQRILSWPSAVAPLHHRTIYICISIQ